MVIIVVAHFDWKHSSKTLFHIGAVAPHPWYESPTPSHPQGAFIELGSGDCGDHLNSSHSSIVSPISDLAFCVMITDQVLEWSIPSSQHATTNNQCWWRDCRCNILPFLVRQPLRSPVVCLLAHRPVVVALRTNKIRWDVGIDMMTPFLSSTKNKPHTHTHTQSQEITHAFTFSESPKHKASRWRMWLWNQSSGFYLSDFFWFTAWATLFLLICQQLWLWSRDSYTFFTIADVDIQGVQNY